MLRDLTEGLQAYRTLDPEGWLQLYRVFPMGIGILLVVLGVLLLLWGGVPRYYRIVAGPLGAWAGAVWLPVALGHFGMPPSAAVPVVCAAVLGVAGVLYPAVTVFFACGLPAGLLLGGAVGSSDWALGFLPAFLLVGGLAASMQRPLAAVTASMTGAWLLVLGLLSSLHQVGGLVSAMVSQPWGVVVAAALFATSGAVFQLAVRPSDEEAQKLAAEKAKAKRAREEKKALEKRWANYSANRNK